MAGNLAQGGGDPRLSISGGSDEKNEKFLGGVSIPTATVRPRGKLGERDSSVLFEESVPSPHCFVSSAH